MKTNKQPKIWKWILLVLLIIVGWSFMGANHFTYTKTITIQEWNTVQKLFQDLSWKHTMQVKRYIRRHNVDFSKLQMGSYIFSGTYTPATFVTWIQKWPSVAYTTIKILEGRSMYDIDNSLAAKGLISSGAYISFVRDPSIIAKYQQKYPFLTRISLKNLEWFLYPDTYKVDQEKNLIDQLVYLQLETFTKRVWADAQTKKSTSSLAWYDVIKLASIVEKEERSQTNRPTVAGVLLKRFQLGTLIGADISLCYFFEKPYKECTPGFIAQHVSDTNNPYNTRSLKWLPPTPVSNPSASSIFAVLQPNITDYLFYLHDSQGQIHYATTLDEHNANVRNYLR